MGHLRWVLLVFFLIPGCGTNVPPVPYDAPARSGKILATVAIYGDSRPTGLPLVWEREETGKTAVVVGRMVQESPDLILHTGDLVFSGGSGKYWAQFDEDHRAVKDKNIPFYPVLGNHEYLLTDTDTAIKNFTDHFPLLKGRLWYEIRMGPVLFLMLNSNFGRMSRKENRAQDRWLDQQLDMARESADIRAVILVCHHPPYTNALFQSPNRDIEERFVTRIQGHPKVRAFIAGHVHSYERFMMDGVTYIVTGGGGAPLVPIQHNPKKATFKDLCPSKDRRYHFCLGRLTREGLNFEVWNLGRDNSWSVMDRFEFTW